MPCKEYWPLLRNSHLGAMVIVRREGFSNDQWLIEGINLLDLKYTRAGYFAADPSQLVRPNGCRDGLHRHDRHVAAHASARRFRLRLADRRAALRPATGRRDAAGLARTGFYPLSTASMTALSIVVPCFNEEACLARLHERLTRRRARGAWARIMRSCWSTTARATRAGRSCRSIAAADRARRRGQPVAQSRAPAGADRGARPVPRRHDPDHRRRPPGPARAARRDARDDARRATPTWSMACAGAAPARPRSSARRRTASTACCRARPRSTSRSMPAISG